MHCWQGISIHAVSCPIYSHASKWVIASTSAVLLVLVPYTIIYERQHAENFILVRDHEVLACMCSLIFNLVVSRGVGGGMGTVLSCMS